MGSVADGSSAVGGGISGIGLRIGIGCTSPLVDG